MLKRLHMIPYLLILTVFLAIFSVQSPATATDIDILDVKSTFKIGGVTKNNVVITTSSGKAIAFGVRSVTGTSTFASGLTTVTAVIATPDAIVDDVRYVMGTATAGNITLQVYGINAGTSTALSTTPVNVNWQAVGLP